MRQRSSPVARALTWALVVGSVTGASVVRSVAQQARPYSGEDAAYLDWAWKNCSLLSTAKARKLGDEARDKGGDAFMRGYDQQYRKILESAPKADEVRRLCEQVSGWYGEWGSRIDGLIASKDAAPNSPGVLVGKRTPPKK